MNPVKLMRTLVLMLAIASSMAFTASAGTMRTYQVGETSPQGFRFTFLHKADRARHGDAYMSGSQISGVLDGVMRGELSASNDKLMGITGSFSGPDVRPNKNDSLNLGGSVTVNILDGGLGFAGGLTSGWLDFQILDSSDALVDDGTFFFSPDVFGSGTEAPNQGDHEYFNLWGQDTRYATLSDGGNQIDWSFLTDLGYTGSTAGESRSVNPASWGLDIHASINPPSPTPIPEPSSLAIALAGGTLCVARRRRRQA